MDEKLAQRLLAKVMGWDHIADARERVLLQALAAFKYDEYQQYSPGMRFIESLAIWLSQFETAEEKQLAYEIVKNKLVYFSTIEMQHLVRSAFPDIIRPILVTKVADRLGIHSYYVNKILNSVEFKSMLRKSLFLGLSEGAHLDVLRRSNPLLSNEQIVLTYDLSGSKRKDLLDDLRKDLGSPDVCFEHLFLLDDFTASGTSYIRSEQNSLKGKVWKALNKTLNTDKDALFQSGNIEVHLIIYIGTQEAKEVIEERLRQGFKNVKIDLCFMQTIPNSCSVACDNKHEEFLKKYFDETILDKHWEKAARRSKPYLGYNECNLPVVLSHNTPNNTIPILWFSELHKFMGLFPRVIRHK